MNRRFLLSTCAALVIIPVISCCALVPDYEVLEVPRPVEQFRAAKEWIDKIGPTGAPLASTSVEKGASSLTAEIAAEVTGRIDNALTNWVSGALGMNASETVELELVDLEHEVVTDVYDLATTAPVLWEVIRVSSFSLDLKNKKSASITAQSVSDKLTEKSAGSAAFSATATRDGGFHVKADRPVVAAIRVVDLGYRRSSKSGPIPLDLQDTSVGRSQSAPFGYRLILQEPVDAIRQQARIHIDNDNSRKYPGEEHVFEKNSPWINPNRTAIKGEDRELEDALYVWDKVSIIWAPDLSKCSAHFARQYMKPTPIKSGLSGVR